MFKVDLPPDTCPMYTYTTCCECEQLRARVAELEAERDAARKERNEYFSERNKVCERASALMVERDALKAELSDCKADLAAYEAQRPDDDTFSLLAASYERKISQVEADNERMRKALKKIAGSGPVPSAYEAWSWCYDIAKAALAAEG